MNEEFSVDPATETPSDASLTIEELSTSSDLTSETDGDINIAC